MTAIDGGRTAVKKKDRKNKKVTRQIRIFVAFVPPFDLDSQSQFGRECKGQPL